MANEIRHAAWQSERRFAVRLLPEEGDPTVLVAGLGDFLEAVDFAVEWLAREDPERTGTAGLAIFETSIGDSEKVWAYPPDDSPDEVPLMKIFGFDPVNWKAASPGYSPREPALGTFFTRAPATPEPPAAPRPAPIAPPPAAVVAAGPVDEPPAAPLRPPSVAPPRPLVVATAPEEPPEPTHRHLRPRKALAAAWHDHVARAFLLLAAISLWLAVAFSDAGVLVFALAALSGLWWRRDKLGAAAKTDTEDWL